MKNRFLKTCSFFDDQDFKEYNSEPYNFDKKIDIIVTPINFYFKMKNTANYTIVHYNNVSEFKYHTFKDVFEIFVFKNDSINIITSNDCKQRNGELRLFARLKGRPDTAFPLFGKCKKNIIKYDPISFFEKNEKFISWFEGFLEVQDQNQFLLVFEGDRLVCKNESLTNINFSYLI